MLKNVVKGFEEMMNCVLTVMNESLSDPYAGWNEGEELLMLNEVRCGISLMEGDSSVGRALLNCRGRGSEPHSLSFFYSRIECWREKRIALYGRMSSEERKEKCYYGKTSKDEL